MTTDDTVNTSRIRIGAAGSMDVVPGIGALDRALGRLFVVVGVFDGLHLGHAYLLRELLEASAARDARPTVITFDHHPDEVLTGSAPPLLLDPAERLQRLEAAGVQVTVVQTFDAALRDTPFEAFVGRIAERVDLAGFLMTPDSAFGHRRAGTPETVGALGRELGYDVVVVPPFTIGGAPVSSSAIRAAIEIGDLAAAERLLGRPYTVVGTVVSSDRGPRLTFPVPAAVPVEGTYPARIWGPDDDSDQALRRQVTIDREGSILLPGDVHPGKARRVAFEVRGGAPSTG
jgi:riboflavin kinase/FMN adenylyltransferase